MGCPSILDRIDNAGAGGYCTQFSLVLSGMMQAFGWQARQVNGGGHAVMEVWNDEFAKWVFMDPYTFGSCYNYDPITLEPQSLLELHRVFLDYYAPGRSLEWGKDSSFEYKPIEGREPPVKRGSKSVFPATHLTGFLNGAFIRFVTRNDWFSNPLPRPLTDGSSMDWPIKGFVNWYATARAQAPLPMAYRPRARLWPELNRYMWTRSRFRQRPSIPPFRDLYAKFQPFRDEWDGTNWKEVGERWTWLLQSEEHHRSPRGQQARVGRKTIAFRGESRRTRRSENEKNTCIRNRSQRTDRTTLHMKRRCMKRILSGELSHW